MKKGFTLIELLVVISIVAVLSALLMANFIGVRQRSRDAVRKSDLQNIRQALELYRADYGSYPLTLVCGEANSLTNPDDPSIVYMNEIPCDPISTTLTTEYTYAYDNGNGTYTLTACLENPADSENEIVSCTGSADACCTDPFEGKTTYSNP